MTTRIFLMLDTETRDVTTANDGLDATAEAGTTDRGVRVV
jgi:hypothetical protein